jgi:membrane-associated protease RseP (regulator of RpoE activity)
MALRRGSPLTLVVAVAVVVYALVLLGGWPLPVVIGSVLLMIMGHEFGHYITAKRSGMLVTDFFVGFGPVLWSRTIGETRYGVRAFPLGGYVKVPGMTWTEPINADLESRTYRSASYPRKVLFASAGSLMHLVMAFLLAFSAFFFVGTPHADHVAISSFTHFDNVAVSPAQRGGLHVGDRIVAVDGRPVSSTQQIVDFVHAHAGVAITLSVLREGHNVSVHVTPLDGRHLSVNHQRLTTGPAAVGYLGISLDEQIARSNFFSSISSAGSDIATTTTAALQGLAHVFSPSGFGSLFHQVASPQAANNPTNQLNRPESIVGVVRIAVQSAHSNVETLLQILVAVNIFVGLLNMIPLLPLDGGYVAVATYERIRSRRSRPYHADVNKLTPIVYAFMGILLVLFASTLYLDIAHPIVNPFH